MMRKFLISLTLLAAPLVISACGFSPMHAKMGATDATNLKAISVVLQETPDVTNNQAGFFVVQNLRDRIGSSKTAKYMLRVTPAYSTRRLGITGNDVASRYDVTLRSSYQLLDIKTGDVLDTGNVQAVTTFGAPVGPFGIVTADDVGTRQAAKEVSDRLIVDLARYFSDNPA